MRPSSPLLENLIQQNYSGVELPPLWQVIYQESIRGHHLLFKRSDVELFDSLSDSNSDIDYAAFSSLEGVVVDIVCCNDLNGMVQIIDSLTIGQRHLLYVFYQRALWIWRNYSKEQMN